MVSFIVPAHNEQAVIARTLQAIHDSARVVGQPYEIIVVDDASTDATAEIARHHQAAVVSVNHRQIAATRNSGARAARGERWFFVDADTTIDPRAIASALRCLDRGAVGGGACVRFDGIVPLYIQLLSVLSVIPAKLLAFCGGAFLFCTREAFEATGGFDERLYGGEELAWAFALKREGRFVVLLRRVLTSGRRVRVMSGLRILATVARLACSPFSALTRRSSVEKIWYDSNRERDDTPSGSLAFRLSNAITLLITLVLLTGPIWNFVPRSLTPPGSLLGASRFGCALLLCHAGMLFWPCAGVLSKFLFRRNRWTEWIKLAALVAFCYWQAWESTRGVIWIWTRAYEELRRLLIG